MRTQIAFFNVAYLLLTLIVTSSPAAPVPKPPPPHERATLECGKRSRAEWLAFSPDGKLLASAEADKSVKLWDVRKGEKAATLSGHDVPVSRVAFSPDGKLLASAGWNGSLRLWDVGTLKAIDPFWDRSGWTDVLFFSPDGKILFNGHFWNLQKKERSEKHRFQDPDRREENTAYCLTYGLDGKLLGFVWSRRPSSRRARVWDFSAGQLVHDLEYPEEGGFRRCAAFSPDCKLVVSAFAGVCVWDVTSGKRLSTCHDPAQIYALAFNPEGTLLAVGWRPDEDHKKAAISILDPMSGKELAVLRGHKAPIICVAFSPDGRTLASSSFDQTIKLWDVRGVKALKKTDAAGAVPHRR